MAFMEDLKTDQRTQILVAGMIFFAIAFPVYFAYAASDVDDYEITGPIGTYKVNGTYDYHLLQEGTETIADGQSADLAINTDSIGSEIDGKTIVGVRATITFEDNEQAGALCSTAADDVSGHLMHSDKHNTQEVSSGDIVEILWHNSSLINQDVENTTNAELTEMLEIDESLGMGEHYLQISVNVNKGDCPDDFITPRENTDNDEVVSYKWELISLDYEIEMVEEEDSEDEDSGE